MDKQYILSSLSKTIENPVCELNYNSDYTLLIAILLSAQALDKNVNKITPILFDKYPTLIDLKNADLSDLEKIIHPLGLSKNKSKAIKNLANDLMDKYNGIVPNSRKELASLPGIGNKSAGVFLIEFYKQNFLPVDTHVKRVSYRLGLVKQTDNTDIIESKLTSYFNNKNLALTHQRLVLFGRYICTSKKPKCETCLFNKKCILTK